jgi:hypothetical protein
MWTALLRNTKSMSIKIIFKLGIPLKSGPPGFKKSQWISRIGIQSLEGSSDSLEPRATERRRF